MNNTMKEKNVNLKKVFSSESKLLSVIADLKGKGYYQGDFGHLFPQYILARKVKNEWSFYLKEDEYYYLGKLGKEIFSEKVNVDIYLEEALYTIINYNETCAKIASLKEVPKLMYNNIVIEYMNAYSLLLSVYRLTNREYTQLLDEECFGIKVLSETRLKIRHSFMRGNEIFNSFLQRIFAESTYIDRIREISLSFVLDYNDNPADATFLKNVEECILQGDELKLISYGEYDFELDICTGEQKDKGIFYGKVAYSGETVICKVKVVSNSKEMSELDKEENSPIILVAKMVNMIQEDYDKNVVGIICEEGGILSHASVIAREKRIPCLLDVKNAVKYFKNECRVELNTRDGYVKVVDL